MWTISRYSGKSCINIRTIYKLRDPAISSKSFLFRQKHGYSIYHLYYINAKNIKFTSNVKYFKMITYIGNE